MQDGKNMISNKNIIDIEGQRGLLQIISVLHKKNRNKEKEPYVIGITMGDFNGIGPEITLKAAKEFCDSKSTRVVIIGSEPVIQYVNSKLKNPVEYINLSEIDEIKRSKKKVFLLDIFEKNKFQIKFGRITKQAGSAAGFCVEKAVSLLSQRNLTNLVTAPVSKEALF